MLRVSCQCHVSLLTSDKGELKVAGTCVLFGVQLLVVRISVFQRGSVNSLGMAKPQAGPNSRELKCFCRGCVNHTADPVSDFSAHLKIVKTLANAEFLRTSA